MTDTEVFIYTGAGEAVIPRDVVRVRVDPSVTSIPAKAFEGRKKLTEVELCEGLVEIGNDSFARCDRSITKINIPNSIRRINDWAFMSSLQCPIRLHDDIESIGLEAFASCIFTNFRFPPLITEIPAGILYGCRSMFSVEIPDNTTEFQESAFGYCYCLRNVAFPPNAVFGDRFFVHEGPDKPTDLHPLFGSDLEIIRELMRRFDRLPIHKLVYYQSFHQGVL